MNAAIKRSKDLSVQKGEKVDRANIEFHAGKIMIPNGMTMEEAAKLLIERSKFMQQPMAIQRTYDVFPWDAALALQRVFKEAFGWVPTLKIPGLFKDTPPTTVSVEVALGKTEQVPWGRFGIPGAPGFLQIGAQRQGEKVVTTMTGEVLRKDENLVNSLLDAMQLEIRTRSIYLGQAFKVRFRDNDGDYLPIPEVKFIPTDVTMDQLIFSKDLEGMITTNLFTPITRSKDCERNGIPVKRGVLLGGMYGTGKTLAAGAAARLAVQVGVTYIYVPRADELKDAIDFAKQYAEPACVVFCEDIDRVMEGARSIKMDDILNIIDGIDGKNSNIIVVLTTNFLDKINQAMLRPGRLDAVIEVMPPDGEAITRLIRHYAGVAVSRDVDLTEVGKELAGQIPAVVSEVVKRAKLSELRRTPVGEQVTNLSAESLLEAARTMTGQLNLLKPKVAQPVPELDRAMRNVIRHAQRNANGADTAGVN